MIVWLVLLFGLSCASAVEVNFTGDWKIGVGWELVCTWSFPQRDRLQSVRLSRAGLQFKIYRPETSGHSLREDFRVPDGQWMRLACNETDQHSGICVLTLDLLQPPTINPVVYTCEVSGERPMFLIETKDYMLEPFVPSNDAHIEVKLDPNRPKNTVHLNCTATGLPAPNLTWTVGRQKVQGDFSGKLWNITTKLMHVWSTVTLTPSTEDLPVLCVPEQKDSRSLQLGPPAEYMLQKDNGAGQANDVFRIAVISLVLLSFFR